MNRMICKVIRAGHKAYSLVNYIAKKALGITANMGFGTMRFSKKRLPWAIEGLRSFHGDSRASEARHIVFSLPKGTPRIEAKKSLRAVADDWLKTYAPDHNWLLALQYHNQVWHAHLAVANVSADGKPIKLRPHQVKAMATMAFTNHASNATGTGKQGLPFYTKARRKLSVEQLAEKLVMNTGEINSAEWSRLQKEGVITNFRNRTDGSVISFEFQKRRLRVALLRRLLTEKQKQKQKQKNYENKPRRSTGNSGNHRYITISTPRQRTLRTRQHHRNHPEYVGSRSADGPPREPAHPPKQPQRSV